MSNTMRTATDPKNGLDDSLLDKERPMGLQDFQNSDEEDEFDDFALDTDNELNIEPEPSQHDPTSSVLERNTNNRERNFFARNFRPPSQAGIRSSAFTLITGTMGAGVLGLPKVSTYFGLALSIVILILFGLVTMHSYFILNDAIVHSKKRGYANVSAFYFGKLGGRVVVFIIIITQFVACVMYCVMSWQFLESIIDDYTPYHFTKTTDPNGQVSFEAYAQDTFLMRIYCLVPLAILLLPIGTNFLV
jgi:hypothetical protein